MTVTATPGPGTGATREDYIWCDTRPDDAEFQLVVIPASQASGRVGLRVGSIFAPAGANTAAAMSMNGARVDFGHLPGLTLTAGGLARTWINSTQSGLLYIYSPEVGMEGSASISRARGGTYGPATGTGYTACGPSWSIPGADLMDHARYRITAEGRGNMGAGGDSAWRAALGGLPNGPSCNVPAGAGTTGGANGVFSWYADIEIQVNGPGEQTAAVTIRAGSQWMAAGNVSQGELRAGVSHLQNVPMNRSQNYSLSVSCAWLNASAGRNMSGYSGLFERLGGGGHVPQPLALPISMADMAVPELVWVDGDDPLGGPVFGGNGDTGQMLARVEPARPARARSTTRRRTS
jgi:hypothetical protein